MPPCRSADRVRCSAWRARVSIEPTANEDDLALMRRLDELFLAHPFLGSRRIAAMLQAEGRTINRKRVH